MVQVLKHQRASKAYEDSFNTIAERKGQILNESCFEDYITLLLENGKDNAPDHRSEAIDAAALIQLTMALMGNVHVSAFLPEIYKKRAAEFFPKLVDFFEEIAGNEYLQLRLDEHLLRANLTPSGEDDFDCYRIAARHQSSLGKGMEEYAREQSASILNDEIRSIMINSYRERITDAEQKIAEIERIHKALTETF